MDLPICFLLLAMLLAAVYADPTDQGPQMFSEAPSAETPQQPKKQQKREPSFDTKEVILYLTPSQIRAYESGKGLMPHEQAVQLRKLEEGQGLRKPQQSTQFGSSEEEKRLEQPQQNVQFAGFEPERDLKPPQKEPQFGTSFELPQLQAPQLELSPNNEQMKNQMQNTFNSAAQKMLKEVQNFENKQKDIMQRQGENQSKLTKDNLQQLAPENNGQQYPNNDLQKREKYIQLPLQFMPQSWPYVQQQYGIPATRPHFEPQFIAPVTPQIEQQIFPLPESQLEYSTPLWYKKPELGAQNYAYLYFYPHGKPLNHNNLQLFYPSNHEQKPTESVFSQESPTLNLHSKFQLVPYEYAYQNKLEAKQILQAQLENYHFDAHRLQPDQLEAHQLEDFNSQQLLIQKHLEPQYQQQHEKLNLEEHKFEPQELKLKIIPHTAALLAQSSKEINVDLKTLDSARQDEMKQVYEAQKLKAKIEAQEKEARRLDAQLKEEEFKAEQFKAEQQIEQLFSNQEFKDELLKGQDFNAELIKHKESNEELFKEQDFKELFKNQHFKAQFKNQEFKEELFKNQEYKDEVMESPDFKGLIKNQEFSGEIKSEQTNGEIYKNEYQDLAYLQKLEPKRTQMYTILNPLFQGHSIVESLQKKKSIFPHHRINLETGFKPLQYAPKFNDQKYAREIEKILKRNHVEKQKAVAKAAAIANEPPEMILSEEKVIVKSTMPKIRQVEAPFPAPIEMKVTQPHQLEIIKPYPISIMQMEKVELHKPVPIEIEKHVPVPVTKHVYVKVDKPYYVKKVVPVEVKKEIPVEIPLTLKSPLKLSIIKHVWNK